MIVLYYICQFLFRYFSFGSNMAGCIILVCVVLKFYYSIFIASHLPSFVSRLRQEVYVSGYIDTFLPYCSDYLGILNTNDHNVDISILIGAVQ